jgi:hypothetical protein
MLSALKTSQLLVRFTPQHRLMGLNVYQPSRPGDRRLIRDKFDSADIEFKWLLLPRFSVKKCGSR